MTSKYKTLLRILLLPLIFVALWNIAFFTTAHVVWDNELRSYVAFFISVISMVPLSTWFLHE